MKIENRTFLISGGSSGLGLGATTELISKNAFVAILDLNPPPATSLPEAQYLFIKTDVSKSESIKAAIHSAIQWTQKTSAPISGVICSAGIGTAALALPRQPADATHDSVKYFDMAAFDRTIAINLRGTVDLIRLAVPHMALNEPFGPDGERGVIIVVSSVASFEGQIGQLSYAASKGGVRSIVLPLARELGQRAGIRVVGIAPGVIESNMTVPKNKPKDDSKQARKPTGQKASMNTEMANYPRRMGSPAEFASLCREIISNPFINGDVIRLDGGVRMPSRL